MCTGHLGKVDLQPQTLTFQWNKRTSETEDLKDMQAKDTSHARKTEHDGDAGATRQQSAVGLRFSAGKREPTVLRCRPRLRKKCPGRGLLRSHGSFCRGQLQAGSTPNCTQMCGKGKRGLQLRCAGPESELPCEEKTQSTAERDRASETGSPLFRAGRRVRPGLRAAQGKEPQVLPRHCSVQLGVEGKARAPHP